MRKTPDIGTVWRTPYGDIFRVVRVEDHQISMEPIELLESGFAYADDGTIPFTNVLASWKPVEVMEL